MLKPGIYRDGHGQLFLVLFNKALFLYVSPHQETASWYDVSEGDDVRAFKNWFDTHSDESLEFVCDVPSINY